MGTIFRCSIIANFEIIAYLLLLITSAILLFGVSDLDTAFTSKLFIYSVLFAGMLSFPTNKGLFQFGKYLFLVGIGIFMTIGMKNDPKYVNDVMMNLIINRFWTVFIIASIISLVIAVYAYMNIDEVLSLRMLYQNSDVAIFEFSLLYILDRFCNITLSIVVCTFWLWFTIMAVWAT